MNNPRVQTRAQPRSNVKKLHNFSKYNKTKYSAEKLRDTILVIAILIEITTYQAGFNPPRGVWKDTNCPDDTNNSNLHDGKTLISLTKTTLKLHRKCLKTTIFELHQNSSSSFFLKQNYNCTINNSTRVTQKRHYNRVKTTLKLHQKVSKHH